MAALNKSLSQISNKKNYCGINLVTTQQHSKYVIHSRLLDQVISKNVISEHQAKKNFGKLKTFFEPARSIFLFHMSPRDISKLAIRKEKLDKFWFFFFFFLVLWYWLWNYKKLSQMKIWLNLWVPERKKVIYTVFLNNDLLYQVDTTI